jgi:hypothetical protein
MVSPWQLCTTVLSIPRISTLVDRQISTTTMTHSQSYPQPLTHLDDPILPNLDTLVPECSALLPLKDPFGPPGNCSPPESFVPQSYQDYDELLFDEAETLISQGQGQKHSATPFQSVEAHGPLDEPNRRLPSGNSTSYSSSNPYGTDLFAHLPHDAVRVETFRAFSMHGCE